DSFDLRDDAGNALGEFVGEAAEIAEDRGKAGGEEEGEDEGDRDDQENNGHCTRGVVTAEARARDVGDSRHEDYGEESADVEDHQLFLDCPSESEEEKDADGEEDVAADVGAGSQLVGGELVGVGGGQRGSPEGLTFD